ncbi:MAG: glycosyltransferase family 1 protein [Acidimicrobiales bacterium]|nr:glycosyltransferase family 1 protein [Acidimicrobiales bacterium]
MTTTVGINLLWLVPGVVGGSETSTTTTLHAIADDPPDDLHHVLFALAPFVEAHPELAGSYEIETLPLSGRLKGMRVGAEQTWLAERVRRRGVDAMHHMGGTMPLVPGPASVLSIHDLQPFDHPENFHPLKRAWLAWAVPRSVARAGLVLTPSDWVRRTVLDRFEVDPALVQTVHHGVPPLPPPAPASEVRARHGIDGPFIFYAAITYPHKDHRTLVRAMSRLAADHPDVSLVLSGGVGPAEQQVMTEIAALGLSHRVKRLGRVTFPEVVTLLEEATVVAFPSRYEGFGVPLVEAMSLGRPLVAADATAIPEVVADGGLLVPPAAVDAWADALDRLLGDEALRVELGERGRRRADAFSPERNARATVAAHRRVAGRGGATVAGHD